MTIKSAPVSVISRTPREKRELKFLSIQVGQQSVRSELPDHCIRVLRNDLRRQSEQHIADAVAVSAAVHDDDSSVPEERRQVLAEAGRIARLRFARAGPGGLTRNRALRW